MLFNLFYGVVMTSSSVGKFIVNFAKVSQFQSHFSPRRKRFSSNLTKKATKRIDWAFRISTSKVDYLFSSPR